MAAIDSPTHGGDSEDPMLEKLKLEVKYLGSQNEKLGFEINELKNESAFLRRANRWVPIVTSFLGLGGLYFGVMQYWGAESKALSQRQDEIRRETAKPLWDKRLNLFIEATDAAATVATAKDMDSPESIDAEARFWVLYYGPMSAVEDTGLADRKKKAEGNLARTVENAMVAFGRELEKDVKERDADTLKELSLELAHVVREAIDPKLTDERP